MEHLSVAVPGELDPAIVGAALGAAGAALDWLESLSLLITSAERARALRDECGAMQGRLIRLARAGYAPLRSMPLGSYVSSEFDRLGEKVSDYLRRLRRVLDHCQQVETLAVLREQADAEREHRRRFPEELELMEAHREVLAALYPDRWLLLYEGAIRGEFDDAQKALAAGEATRGRDEGGRPNFLVFCHRTTRKTAL